MLNVITFIKETPNIHNSTVAFRQLLFSFEFIVALGRLLPSLAAESKQSKQIEAIEFYAAPTRKRT